MSKSKFISCNMICNYNGKIWWLNLSKTIICVYSIFVSPELSSVRDYVITHSVRSM